jgi:hypothetical protein
MTTSGIHTVELGSDATLVDWIKRRATVEDLADPSTVQDFLGHASPETTKMIYAQYSPSHLRQAARKYAGMRRVCGALMAGRDNSRLCISAQAAECSPCWKRTLR